MEPNNRPLHPPSGIPHSLFLFLPFVRPLERCSNSFTTVLNVPDGRRGRFRYRWETCTVVCRSTFACGAFNPRCVGNFNCCLYLSLSVDGYFQCPNKSVQYRKMYRTYEAQWKCYLAQRMHQTKIK